MKGVSSIQKSLVSRLPAHAHPSTLGAAHAAATDAPTWIASPADLADWPVADVEPGIEAPLDEETHVHDVLEVERAVAVELEQDEDEPEAPEPEPEPERRPPRRPVAHDRSGSRTARHRIDPLAAPAANGKR